MILIIHRLGDQKTLKTLEDLGFLSDEPIAKMGSPLDSVGKSSPDSYTVILYHQLS